MLCKFLFSLSAAASLAAAGLIPARDAGAVLVPRENTCETTSVYEHRKIVTVNHETVTVTYGHSALGKITSTSTKSETRTIVKASTVISPSIVHSPTTTASPVVATVTTSMPYIYYTTIVTSPGYAPSSLCQETTFTHVIPGTTTATIEHDRTYATVWTSTVGHVTTETEIFFTTSTRTTTEPGPTTWDVTVTEPVTATSVELIFPTITSTVWEKGCQSYACQS